MSSPLGLFVPVTGTRTRVFKVKQVAAVMGGLSQLGKKHKMKGLDLGRSETEEAPEQNTYEMHTSEYRKLRCSNPYRWQKRTYTGGDKMFWTNTQ